MAKAADSWLPSWEVGRDSLGGGGGRVGPNQEPGLWGAGCFHGQAGNCQVYSSDEMWQQIK